jgi:hypothetical protein
MTTRSYDRVYVCRNCNVTFNAFAPRQVFCNPTCAMVWSKNRRSERVEKICNICESTFSLTANFVKRFPWKSTCLSCIAKIQHEEKRSVRQCIVCGVKFTGVTSQTKICSDACKARSSKHVKPKFTGDYSEKATRLQKIGNKLPCKSCLHGKANKHSDTGYECLLNARVCSPFTMMRLYEEKQDV